jgi:hypothetical protein
MKDCSDKRVLKDSMQRRHKFSIGRPAGWVAVYGLFLMWVQQRSHLLVEGVDHIIELIIKMGNNPYSMHPASLFPPVARWAARDWLGMEQITKC